MVMLFNPSVINHGIAIEKGIHDNTVLLVNTGEQSLTRQFKKEYLFKDIYYVDATEAALAHTGREIPNSAMLGALAGTGIVGIESIVSSIKEFFGTDSGEKNAAAAWSAYEKISWG
jgi:Pyruvate/2-oxoacid:ferredoxin oxidoreductase gamma subunit